MTPRLAFPNEVLSVYSACGRVCIAIVERPDGMFQGYVDELRYDGDEDVYYWNRVSNGYTGLYPTADDLARDARNWPGFEGP